MNICDGEFLLKAYDSIKYKKLYKFIFMFSLIPTHQRSIAEKYNFKGVMVNENNSFSNVASTGIKYMWVKTIVHTSLINEYYDIVNRMKASESLQEVVHS